jgi:hypothetical protein
MSPKMERHGRAHGHARSTISSRVQFSDGGQDPPSKRCKRQQRARYRTRATPAESTARDRDTPGQASSCRMSAPSLPKTGWQAPRQKGWHSSSMTPAPEFHGMCGRDARTQRSRASSMARGPAQRPASRAPRRERRMEAMNSAMQPFSAVGQAWGGPRASK